MGLADRKYLLCRPIAGLNDTLNQIEICRAYAARHGRVLLVDGRHSGVLGEFGDYFVMEGEDIILNMSSPGVPDIDSLECYPPQVQGRVSSVRAKSNPVPGAWGAVDFDTDVLLSFPMDRDHPQALLLHQQWGGGTRSFDLIKRLTLVPELAARARRRVAGLPIGYSAIHIRNTDYRTDLGMVVDAMKNKVIGKDLLVCSDDAEVFAMMQQALPDTRLHQITAPVFDGGRAQHTRGRWAGPAVRRRVAAGSLYDLCALAGATTLYLPVLQSKVIGAPADFTGQNRLSGFSMLAAHLCEDKDRLRRLLGEAGVGFRPRLKTGTVHLIEARVP